MGGLGNPLQYSCLENPVDRASWATVYGFAELDTTEKLTLSLSFIFTSEDHCVFRQCCWTEFDAVLGINTTNGLFWFLKCILPAWVHAKLLQSYLTLWDPMDYIAYQPSLSMGFSRQEYWSGLPCSPSGDLPYPGMKPSSLTSPALAGKFFTVSATWEVQSIFNNILIKWKKRSHLK